MYLKQKSCPFFLPFNIRITIDRGCVFNKPNTKEVCSLDTQMIFRKKLEMKFLNYFRRDSQNYITSKLFLNNLVVYIVRKRENVY